MSGNGVGGDDMSIQEIWAILARHRIAALISFLVVVLAASTYLALAKPIYEAEGSFYIGRLRGAPIDSPALVALRLDTFRKERATGGASLATVTPDRRDNRLIHFTVQGTSPDEVQTLADQVIASVLENHAKQVGDKTDPLVVELRELQKVVADGRAATEDLKKHLHSNFEVAAALMYSTMEMGKIRARIGELEQQLGNGTEPTEVVGRPVVGKTPVLPRKGSIFMLALFGGTLAALVVPFIINIVVRRRSA